MPAAVSPTLPQTAEELLAAITDPTAPPEPNALERITDAWALPHLVNKDDVVFTRLMTAIVTQVFPLVIVMYLLPGWWAMAAAVPYIAYVYARFGARVMLALHAVTHRPLFKKPHRSKALLITHLFPPFWGLMPFAYRAHHVYMHHTENNGDDDLSGTAEYQRDNLRHFGHYWFRFFAFGYVHMVSWMIRTKRKGVAKLLIGDTLAYAFVLGLALWKPAATIVVFILPFCIMRYLMMAGTWTEHAFVDPDDPTNSYTNSVCLTNTRFNHNCFNAGYHLIHHIVPGRHWADTVAAFEQYLPKMIENDSIIFFGVPNNQVVWRKLMFDDYDYLAERLLDLGNRRPSHEEKVEFLKSRVRGQRGSIKGLLELREARREPATA